MYYSPLPPFSITSPSSSPSPSPPPITTPKNYHPPPQSWSRSSPSLPPSLISPSSISSWSLTIQCPNINPFRTKTQNIYSQEEMNLYCCFIKLATEISLFSLQIGKLDVLGRQNEIWTFGNPFQSKSCQFAPRIVIFNLCICCQFED